MYSASYHEPEWSESFEALDSETKARAAKKIAKILENPHKRHMKGNAKYFCAKVGQYRIAYDVLDQAREVRFYFIGDHKEYAKWYRQFF